MIASLLSRTIDKLPAEIRLDGRVLFLVDDAELVRHQLQGEDLDLTPELQAKLRDNISTDEITPAYICYYYDETLGEFPYLGLKAGIRHSFLLVWVLVLPTGTNPRVPLRVSSGDERDAWNRSVAWWIGETMEMGEMPVGAMCPARSPGPCSGVSWRIITRSDFDTAK
jgi:hypothetical protein